MTPPNKHRPSAAAAAGGCLDPADASQTPAMSKTPPIAISASRYGSAHRSLRARLRPSVELGLVRCARCGRAIASGEPWGRGMWTETVRAGQDQNMHGAIGAL
jgi:hypothetical protein